MMYRVLISLPLIAFVLATNCVGQIVNNPEFDNSTNWWFPWGSGVTLSASSENYQSGAACEVANRTEFWHGISQDILGTLTPDTDYHFQAWVKTVATPEGALRFEMRQVDDRGETYMTLGETMAVDFEWRLLEGGFRYQANGPVTGLNFTISGINLDPSHHAFLVDSVSITENDWRAAADARIEQFRKRNVLLSFVDKSGVPRSDLNIDIQQIGHEFGFGSTLNDGLATNPVYAEFFANHFEWATIEWYSQWKPIETVRGIEDYSNTDYAVEFAKQNGINLRGHALGWANVEFLPEWLDGLTPVEMLAELTDRIDHVVSRYAQVIRHWDVNNEMLDYSFFADNLGVAIRPWMFQRARQNDADVKLFTNEFGIKHSALKAQRYRQMILELASEGAEVGGIGLQSHFFQGNTSAKGLEIALKNLVDLGIEIWATEFDVVNPDDAERAKCLVDFYRYMFSRPEVNGIIMWGFWEGAHWLGPDAALVDLDWTVNAAGQAYFDLIDAWTTREQADLPSGTSDFTFRGFHGRYLITVTDPQTGVSNWHLINVLTDASGADFEVAIVVDEHQDSLTVYGTNSDDEFELDFLSPNIVTVNKSRQAIPIWNQIASLQFQGLDGDDLLTVQGPSVKARFRVSDTETRNWVDGFAFGYSNIENIRLNSGNTTDEVYLFDSAGDDYLLSEPAASVMTYADGTTVTASGFYNVIGNATAGGIDTAEVLDSDAVDYVYSNLTYVRIRDPISVRRVQHFEINQVYSMQEDDRITYDIPAIEKSIALGGGDASIQTATKSFEFSSFRFCKLNFAPNNVDVVELRDTTGDDRLTIDGASLNLYGPGYSFQAQGILAANMVATSGGNDIATIRDSSGDDELTADVDNATLAGPGYHFSVTGFPDVRAVRRNGGVDTARILNPNFLMRLFGQWQQ